MSKKPAALSASLVAVKGMAAPAPDMTGRGTLPVASDLANTIAPSSSIPQRTSVAEGEMGGMPLNFRVPESFRRAFKVYAAQHGLKLNELLRLSFEAYRRNNRE